MLYDVKLEVLAVSIVVGLCAHNLYAERDNELHNFVNSIPTMYTDVRQGGVCPIQRAMRRLNVR